MTERELIYEWIDNAPFAIFSYEEDGKVIVEIELNEEEN